MNKSDIKLIRETSEEKVNDLCVFFYDVKKSLSPQGIETTLNPLFLSDACESCFIDLERHKDFHNLKIAEQTGAR